MAQSVVLRIGNRKPAPVIFRPATIVPEGQPADLPALRFTAAGWTFQSLSDAIYGVYWAASPQAVVTLAAGQSLDIATDKLKPVGDVLQAQVTTDYQGIDGISDGVFVDLVTIEPGGH
jgi:hypothetical protein